MIEITIPAVGESITTAFLAQWHKKNGEAVSKGDLILTIETDKVSTEVTADDSGVLEIIVAEGEEVPIGALVAKIDPSGTANTSASAPASAPAATSVAAPAVSPAASAPPGASP